MTQNWQKNFGKSSGRESLDAEVVRMYTFGLNFNSTKNKLWKNEFLVTGRSSIPLLLNSPYKLFQ
jgi:hypothetical protein